MTNDIELRERYPQSRTEDITDAFMRGVAYGRSFMEVENVELRDLVRDLWLQLQNAYDLKEVREFAYRVRELGIEVSK